MFKVPVNLFLKMKTLPPLRRTRVTEVGEFFTMNS